MRVCELMAALDKCPERNIELMLPGGTPVPAHFHITEVGLVRKDFIDCGGTRRSTSTCVLQVWLANDFDHLFDTTKLKRIIELALPILASDTLDVAFEVQEKSISLFSLQTVRFSDGRLQLQLANKHTACLAPQLCVVTSQNSCESTGCC